MVKQINPKNEDKRYIAIEVGVALAFAVAIVAGSYFFDLSNTAVMWLVAGYIVIAGILRGIILKRKK